MSFGRPPTFSSFTASPPDRGSFPLDHDGECKTYMQTYLDCLRKSGSSSTPCREKGKIYLQCRMAKGLMEREDWKNLGMPVESISSQSTSANASSEGVT